MQVWVGWLAAAQSKVPAARTRQAATADKVRIWAVATILAVGSRKYWLEVYVQKSWNFFCRFVYVWKAHRADVDGI